MFLSWSMKVLIFSPKSEDQAFVSVFETTKHRQSWLLKTQKQRRSVFKKENTFLQTMESEIFLHATHYLAGNFKTGFILNSSNTPQTFFYLFSKEWKQKNIRNTAEMRLFYACPPPKEKITAIQSFFSGKCTFGAIFIKFVVDRKNLEDLSYSRRYILPIS